MEHLEDVFRRNGKIFDGSDEMVNKLFEESIYPDDEETMKALIFPGSPILSAETSNDNETFLHCLSYQYEPNIQVAQLLIDSGINIDKQDANGDTALHLAAVVNSISTSSNMIQLLLKNGAKRGIRNKDGLTPIELSLFLRNLDGVEEFLDEEDKLPNVAEVDRKTRCQHLINCLIRDGNHSNVFNTNYSALAHFFIIENDEETFDYIVNNSKFDINAVCERTTLLNLVIEKGTARMFTTLINAGAALDIECPYTGETPLIVAIQNSRTDVAHFLLDHGVSVNKTQESLLENNSPLHHAVSMQNFEIVVKLLKMDADVNALTYDRSPLLLACSMSPWSEKWPRSDYLRTLTGIVSSLEACLLFEELHELKLSVKIVEVLLDHGADMEAKNASNRTALDQACRYGQLEIVKLLLSRGAKMNQGHVSSLHHAVKGENPGVVKLFLQKGADANYRCAPEKWLRDQFYDNADPPRTPLECATYFIKEDGVCKDIIEALVEYGVDVNVADPIRRQTPLHLIFLSAETKQDIILYDFKSRPSSIKFLLRHNANVNVLDRAGLVPLHYAIRNYVSSTEYPGSTDNPLTDYKPDLVALIAFFAVMIEKKEWVMEENLYLLKDEFALPIYEECKNELSFMKKNISETRNFSFFNILSRDIQYLGNTLKNMDLLQVLYTGEYKKTFPIYAEYLEDRIQEVTILQDLIDLAIFLFQKHVSKDILIELIMTIFKFLNLCDLKNFAKACFVNIEQM